MLSPHTDSSTIQFSLSTARARSFLVLGLCLGQLPGSAGLQIILRAMKLDNPDCRRVLHLIDLIKHHPAERAYAIEQLGSISASAEAVPFLIEALRDDDGDLRGSAAMALGKIGTAAAEAVPFRGLTINGTKGPMGLDSIEDVWIINRA